MKSIEEKKADSDRRRRKRKANRIFYKLVTVCQRKINRKKDKTARRVRKPKQGVYVGYLGRVQPSNSYAPIRPFPVNQI